MQRQIDEAATALVAESALTSVAVARGAVDVLRVSRAELSDFDQRRLLEIAYDRLGEASDLMLDLVRNDLVRGYERLLEKGL